MTDPVLTDPPDTGDVLCGRYRLDGLIGQGGMARVYAARALSLDRDVAVKLFRPGTDAAEDTVRARSEMRALAGLNHPALVTLHDAVLPDGDGTGFLVMELVAGETLRERIAAGRLPEREVAAMTVDLAEALHVVHGAGVVHRDIKPSNVLTWPATMPDRAFRVKLADFGIAYLVDTTRLTTPGMLVGTAAYLAPEQVRGEPLTPAADIYALGLVLIEALTGRRAYPQDSGPAAVMARLHASPELPSTLAPPWRDLLTSMTDADPAARPTAIEVAVAATRLPHADIAESRAAAERLTTVAAPHPSRDLPTAEATAILPAPASVAGRPAVPRRRLVLVGAGALAAVLLTVGIGAAVLAQPETAAPAPTIPAVSDPLQTDLQQLMDEVTP